MTAHTDILAVLEGRALFAVVCADNAEILPTLPDGCFAHSVCDPPYGERTHSNARTNGGGSTRDIQIDFAPLSSFAFVPELLRVSRRWVIAFCELEQLGHYKSAAGEAWARAGIWDRTDGMPQLSGDRPAQGAEGIAIMHAPGKKRWNGGGSRGHWSHGVERGDRYHPTPKPLGLMLQLIELFTDPGDVVFDGFCGSGTTGSACLRLGRRFVGVELNPAYAEIARERCLAELDGMSLRDRKAGQIGFGFGSGA